MQFFKQNKILSGVFILTIAAFAYYFLAPGGKSPATDFQSALQGVGPSADTSAAGNDISSIFNMLVKASISTEVFSTPGWTSLVDISSPVPSDPSGKNDLFAPIGQGGGFSAGITGTGVATSTTNKKN